MDNNYNKITEFYKLLGEDKQLWSIFFQNDYPIPYKNLTLFPVTVDCISLYLWLSLSLKEPHLLSGDINAISMRYLEFIYYLGKEKDRKELFYMLESLLLLVLHKEKTYKDSDGQMKNTIDFLTSMGKIRIENTIYDSDDFDKIREIILQQNDDELVDESINPEILEAYKERQEFEIKKLNYKICNLEDKINILVCLTPYKREEILKMTIRSFIHLSERSSLILNYEIASVLSPNMAEKDRKKIVPYNADTYKTMKQKVRESFSTLDEMKSKIS